jgi:hypothetical protein
MPTTKRKIVSSDASESKKLREREQRFRTERQLIYEALGFEGTLPDEFDLVQATRNKLKASEGKNQETQVVQPSGGGGVVNVQTLSNGQVTVTKEVISRTSITGQASEVQKILGRLSQISENLPLGSSLLRGFEVI